MTKLLLCCSACVYMICVYLRGGPLNNYLVAAAREKKTTITVVTLFFVVENLMCATKT